MSIQQLDVLITVAIHEGITQPEIGRLLSMPQGTVSKNVRNLSLRMVAEGDGHVPRGMELVSVRPDLYNPKQHAVFLTDKGRRLMRVLDGILSGKPEAGAEALSQVQQKASARMPSS